MPKYDPKRKQWYIGSGKGRKYYKSKAAAERSYAAYKSKPRKRKTWKNR